MPRLTKNSRISSFSLGFINRCCMPGSFEREEGDALPKGLLEWGVNNNDSDDVVAVADVDDEENANCDTSSNVAVQPSSFTLPTKTQPPALPPTTKCFVCKIAKDAQKCFSKKQMNKRVRGQDAKNASVQNNANRKNNEQKELMTTRGKNAQCHQQHQQKHWQRQMPLRQQQFLKPSSYPAPPLCQKA